MPTSEIYSYAFKESTIRTGAQTLRGSYDILPGPPIVVGHSRQLLMDWHVVDDLNGCERTVHQPEKYQDNPLIKDMGLGDPGPTSWGSVMRDSDTGLFRLWTVAYDFELVKKLGKLGPGSWYGVYFESEDGIEWRRPDLNLFPEYRTKERNVIVHGGLDNLFVLPLPQRMDERGRYAMIYCNNVKREALPDPENMHGMQNFLAFSEDGIHWADAPENPVWRGRTDTNNCVVYNPERDVFMMFRRSTINAGEIRRIAYSESDDLVSWSQPINIVRRDELDSLMLYAMPVTRHNGLYFGLLQCLHSNPESERLLPNGKDFKMDTQLAWSRDGKIWERHPERPTFIPTSQPTKTSYDWGMARGMANMIEVGDEVYVYYGGYPHLHPPGAQSKIHQGICLATLKKDRFVSIGAGDRGGYMLTKPLAYPGGRLHLNARTAPGGFLRVAVREGEGERDGEWPEGWRFEDSVVVSGDSVDHIIAWDETRGLGSFPSSILRLHFWMEQAELYSFWFD